MSSIILSERTSAPGTPASGDASIYLDNTSKPLMKSVDDLGATAKMVDSGLILTNCSTSTLTSGFDSSNNNPLPGSTILIPNGRLLTTGSIYKCRICVSMTSGTGIKNAFFTFGPNGNSVSDPVLATISLDAGTSVVDTGFIEITAILRSPGSTAFFWINTRMVHNLSTGGLSSSFLMGKYLTQSGNSNTFNSTVDGYTIAITPRLGSIVGSIPFVQSEIYNLNI